MRGSINGYVWCRFAVPPRANAKRVSPQSHPLRGRVNHPKVLFRSRHPSRTRRNDGARAGSLSSGNCRQSRADSPGSQRRRRVRPEACAPGLAPRGHQAHFPRSQLRGLDVPRVDHALPASVWCALAGHR